MRRVPFSPRYHHRKRDNLRHARSRATVEFLSAIILPKNLSHSSPPLLTSPSPAVRTSGYGAGSVVVDFLYPPVDNDQHLPQWPESDVVETRS